MFWFTNCPSALLIYPNQCKAPLTKVVDVDVKKLRLDIGESQWDSNLFPRVWAECINLSLNVSFKCTQGRELYNLIVIRLSLISKSSSNPFIIAQCHITDSLNIRWRLTTMPHHPSLLTWYFGPLRLIYQTILLCDQFRNNFAVTLVSSSKAILKKNVHL